MKRLIIHSFLLLTLVLVGFSSCTTSIPKPILLSNLKNHASCVFVTTDENRDPVTSWVEIDSTGNKLFFFKKWLPKIDSFSSPISIPIEQNMAVHEEGMPKIAFKSDGTMMAIYETSTPIEGEKWGRGDIRYIISKDGGTNWSAPESVFKDSTNTLSFSFGNVKRLANGEIGIAALGTDTNLHGHGRPVVFTQSDIDNHFSPYITIDDKACECCRTALNNSPDGKIVIAFRDLEEENIRDISLSISDDNGKTFHKTTGFSKSHWNIDGCPHNGPSIVMNNINTYVAWYSGGDANGVHFGTFNHSGELTEEHKINNAGKFIQLGLTPDDGVVAAYQRTGSAMGKEFSQIILSRTKDDKQLERVISAQDSTATYPMIQSFGDNSLLVAWKSNNQIYYNKIQAIEINGVPEKNIQPANTEQSHHHHQMDSSHTDMMEHM